MLALVGSTDTRYTFSHSDTHMAKMVSSLTEKAPVVREARASSALQE
jgi:hypothetical protein